LTLISSIVSYSQKITRGPDNGEIYFLGPTHTGTGLYYSTNFGETITCVDSVNFITSIAADKTPGVVYSVTMPVNLYYSNNYGNANSWIFRTGEFDDNIRSGVSEGYIFSGCVLHSEDYGLNFSYHSLNGFFGNPKNNAIDNVDDNIGYVMVWKINVADTIYLFRSYDKFENVNIIQKFNFPNGMLTSLSRGSNGGELLLYYKLSNILNMSYDYGENFTVVDKFNFKNYYSFDIIGGRQTGEIYILYNFVNLMWLNAHTYIFHSIDYGNTFDVFHPFSKGNEPVLANFSSMEKEVLLTTPVEFSNFSIGEITQYQWDFENDGIIDSYDEFPTHIYQDTGYYSVKLSVVGQDSTNSFLKENYINIIDTITSNPDLNYQKKNIFPNPFIDKISIETRPNFRIVEIYDLNGKHHFSKTLFEVNKTEIIDLRTLEKGIYILKIKTEGQDITKKIIKI
jgi:hypothetical protein